MNKTIIAIYGREKQGKSETIKNVCQQILRIFPTATSFPTLVNYSGDILVTVTIGSVKIGFESQGDPNSRMITEDTIRTLADEKRNKDHGGCDIIVCATRTDGATVKKVQEIASDYDYHIIWMSSYTSTSLDHTVLNQLGAESITQIILSLMAGRL